MSCWTRRSAPETLLYRLFHEDGVRVYEPQPVRAECSCSGEAKSPPCFRALFRADDLKGNGRKRVAINVTCEFCRKDYRFTPKAANCCRLRHETKKNFEKELAETLEFELAKATGDRSPQGS